MPDKEKGTTVQSVSRALDILNYFESEEELGISELAARMGLSKSSAYGLVNTLAAYGYLQQTENKRYRLGLRLFELGNVMHQRIDQRAEAKLLRRARSRAERVLKTGKPLLMEKLNAYQRRLVHNAMAEIPGIVTHSEESESRFKRITISRAE